MPPDIHLTTLPIKGLDLCCVSSANAKWASDKAGVQGHTYYVRHTLLV